MSDFAEIKLDEKIEQVINEPGKYKIIMLNDDHTPMEFVVDILQRIFRHSSKTAEQLTLTIHNEGSAIVGTYSFEIAEQKANEAVSLSRANGFPLNLKIEKE
jgi:ATP-dependent Clp protease adaptor protein ClpS